MAAPAKKQILWSVSIAVGIFILLGIVGSIIPYRKVDTWVCPVTGSTRSQVKWFGNFTHGQRVTSPLERWLKVTEPSFEPQWWHLSTKTSSFLARSYACGKAPEIYPLLPILDGVISELGDEKIAGLVTVQRRGNALPAARFSR